MNLTSGEIAPKNGVYNVVAANGNKLGTINMTKGDTMPPTQGANQHFEID